MTKGLKNKVLDSRKLAKEDMDGIFGKRKDAKQEDEENPDDDDAMVSDISTFFVCSSIFR